MVFEEKMILNGEPDEVRRDIPISKSICYQMNTSNIEKAGVASVCVCVREITVS